MHTREAPDFWGLCKNMNCAFPLRLNRFNLTCISYGRDSTVHCVNFQFSYLHKFYKPNNIKKSIAQKLNFILKFSFVGKRD